MSSLILAAGAASESDAGERESFRNKQVVSKINNLLRAELVQFHNLCNISLQQLLLPLPHGDINVTGPPSDYCEDDSVK